MEGEVGAIIVVSVYRRVDDDAAPDLCGFCGEQRGEQHHEGNNRR